LLINKNLRKKIVELIYKAKEGHIPSCLSIIDICDVFYSRILDIDKKNFKK
jgi:transketolase